MMSAMGRAGGRLIAGMTKESPALALPSPHGGGTPGSWLTLLVEKPRNGGFLVDQRGSSCYDPLDRTLRPPAADAPAGGPPGYPRKKVNGGVKEAPPLQ